MRYPKRNGQKLSEEQRKTFDFWRSIFSEIIPIDNESQNLGLTKKGIDLIAWNCAYEVMAYPQESTQPDSKSMLDALTEARDILNIQIDILKK